MAPEPGSAPLTMTPVNVLQLAERLDAFADGQMDDYRPATSDDVMTDVRHAARFCRHAVAAGWLTAPVSIA
jgi:hypothetical protein